MAGFLTQTFWIGLLVGLALSVAWRFIAPGKVRTVLQILASLLVFVPQLIILILLNRSTRLLIYQEALLALWLIGIAAMTIGQLRRRARQASGPLKNPVVLALLAALFGGFGLYQGYVFLADLIVPRTVVEGRVTDMRYKRGGRSPRLSSIRIDDRTVNATRDLYRQLRPGDSVRAEIGAGSGAILRWERKQ